jgi:hypothetical protein
MFATHQVRISNDVLFFMAGHGRRYSFTATAPKAALGEFNVRSTQTRLTGAFDRGCAKTREAPWRAHGCTRSIDGRSNTCGHKKKFASLPIKATRRLFLCSYRFDQRRRTQNTDCSLHVVRQDVKAHLGSHPRKRFRQEVRRAHPELERSERVLDRLSS